MKKKAEQRLTQIKKTFSGQLEEKLSKISELSEKNAALESELVALKEQATVANETEKRENELRHEEEKRGMETKIAEQEALLKANAEKAIKIISFAKRYVCV